MSTATAALRAAIHDALKADTALAALLGGHKIYDEPPRNADFPYVTLGEARVSDYSAGDETLEERPARSCVGSAGCWRDAVRSGDCGGRW